jgi:tRNA threonylcarbamoyladenosine biosynthesis protein TsaE
MVAAPRRPSIGRSEAETVDSRRALLTRRSNQPAGGIVIVLRTSGAPTTKAIAALLARTSRVGDLIVLAGDMGAGKTAFAQGFAAGLDIDEAVTSPTFTLVRSYAVPRRAAAPERPRVMHHLDVYRLERTHEVADLALPELIDDRSVTLIEWGDAVLDALPKDRLEIELAFGDEPEDRVLRFVPIGASWAARLSVLAPQLGVWA